MSGHLCGCDPDEEWKCDRYPDCAWGSVEQGIEPAGSSACDCVAAIEEFKAAESAPLTGIGKIKCPNPNCVDGLVELHGPELEVHRCEICNGPKSFHWAGGVKDCSNGCTVRTRELPPQWNCPHCGYGEYKVRADWEGRLAEHVEQCGMKPILIVQEVQGGDDLMAEAWDLTTRDRHNQYGSAEDAFRAYGHIWTGLLAHKLQPDAVIDASDVCLMMTGLKIAREVRNSKRDNVVDAHGYLSLLSRIRGWVNRR